MAIPPTSFFRFLAENTDLVLALFERAQLDEELDEAELLAFLSRKRSDRHPAPAHLLLQLEGLGIVERAAHADTTFELTPPVEELLRWLTHRQRLNSATVLQAYLDDLTKIGAALELSIRNDDARAAGLALKDANIQIERLRSLSDANREALISAAQQIRSSKENVTAVDRYYHIQRLWELYLEPLNSLVDVRGAMEQGLDRLRTLLNEIEQHFVAQGAVQRMCEHTSARLIRMRRSALHDHLNAIREIIPLCTQIRRSSAWCAGASEALNRIRHEGIGALRLENRIGLIGWKPRYLISDEALRTRVHALAQYQPSEPVILSDVERPPELPFIPREELRTALHAAAPVEDVLSFLLREWPELSLRAHLQAFGQIFREEFGPVEFTSEFTQHEYLTTDYCITACQLRLLEVSQ